MCRPTHSRLRFLIVVTALALAGAIGAPPLAGAEETPTSSSDFWDSIFWTYSAGFDFSQGDYGLSRTSTLYYMPIGVIADYKRFRFRVVLPFLVSDGPTNIRFIGAPMMGPPQVALDSETNSGVGEMVVSGSYLFDPVVKGMPYVELGVYATLPTRSKNELGAGLWAGSVRVDVFREFGPVTPFASGGRTFYSGEPLDDRFFASVGASLKVSDSVAMGLSYDWLEETNGGTPDAHELVPFLSVKVTEHWTLGPYAVFGLSNGSPNYGLGAAVSYAP
jgi:hypothetical protein